MSMAWICQQLRLTGSTGSPSCWSPGHSLCHRRASCASPAWAWATPEALLPPAAPTSPWEGHCLTLWAEQGDVGAASSLWLGKTFIPICEPRAVTDAGRGEGAAHLHGLPAPRSSPGSREAGPILRSSQGCTGQGTAQGLQSKMKLSVIRARQASPALPSWMKGPLGSCCSFLC